MDNTINYKDELIDTLCRTSQEIRRMQAQIAHLEPKASAFDAINTVLGFMPSRRGYGEDLAWCLERRMSELKDEPETKDVPEAEEEKK